MSELKQSLRLDLIDKDRAIRLLEQGHRLGGGLKTFSFALGIFWRGNLEGAMTWGAPASNRAPLAYGLRQAEMLDLRRFWLSDVPPANAESRALSVACRLIGKQYPRLRLLTTYCDTEERAAAYRAAGWLGADAA